MLSKFEYIRKECKICDGKGYTFSDNRVFRGQTETGFANQCECIRRMADYTRFDEANIPREYWDLNIADFKEMTDEKIAVKDRISGIIQNIDNYAHNSTGLLLYGRRGTGKTMLSIEILKAAARAGYSVYYDFYPVVFNEYMKKSFKMDEVKARYEEIFAKTDFVVLDELGKERDYFSAASADSDLISSRFLEMNILKKRANKPTIIISNIQKGLDEVKEFYGEYVYSVMSHNYDIVPFMDDDFRKEGK